MTGTGHVESGGGPLFLGIDGGGTKTAFALVDGSGRVRATHTGDTSNYNQVGFDGTQSVLAEGLSQLLAQADVSPSEIVGAVAGLGGADEIRDEIPKLADAARKALGEIPHTVVNDCEVGWAGALGLEPGINVIAGTGSMAFGRDDRGQSMRCGGWAWTIGDEGSAHWLGRRIFQIFTKQSDGRLERTPLYDGVRRRLNLKEDIEIRPLADRISRKELAAFSQILSEASELGDETPSALYREAAAELALHVKALKKGLNFRSPVTVSGTGGLLQSQTPLLDAFLDELKGLDALHRRPLASPVMGAVLLAVERYRSDLLRPVAARILSTDEADVQPSVGVLA